jgi:hypothetical protein
MWKANGKTTTIQLFLDSLSPKTEICEMLPLEIKKLKEEAQDRTLWRTQSGRGY